jgi:hypothetical protein
MQGCLTAAYALKVFKKLVYSSGELQVGQTRRNASWQFHCKESINLRRITISKVRDHMQLRRLCAKGGMSGRNEVRADEHQDCGRSVDVC